MAISAKSIRVAGVILCIEVDPGKGTSGTKQQFIDVQLTQEQLKELRETLKED